MKIRINETFWLAEENELSPDSLRVNGKRAVQVAPLLRAEAAKVFNRMNTTTTVSFAVTREHADARAAEEYMIAHEAAIPDSGIVEFICHDESGGESHFYLDTGALEATDANNIGCSTTHSYTLVGGRITTTKPT